MLLSGVWNLCDMLDRKCDLVWLVCMVFWWFLISELVI